MVGYTYTRLYHEYIYHISYIPYYTMNIRLISALLEALISGDATFDFGLDAWRGKKFGRCGRCPTLVPWRFQPKFQQLWPFTSYKYL